ncbi:hypothetical protein SYNTR_1737 [Candidatus Syntrophocurvum alkaliphilum]|uniref:Uncharacterized protein n=1 Tax=Candidatus Syntrophocurvum alkaliphilum TaxID=2293317 RepID=A0A6I6DGW4_9FIRM|nr:hypothetical protein SYNTR_1737 [Candidatus Syntrophocurvum alkaliphilum]
MSPAYILPSTRTIQSALVISLFLIVSSFSWSLDKNTDIIKLFCSR